MKFLPKYFILLLMAAFTTLTARSQTGEQLHNLSLGFNGGINMSSVSFAPKVSQKNLIGPGAGLSVRYIHERWFGMLCGVQMELNYAQRGWNEFYEDYPELVYRRKLTYLEVPLMAHIGFGKKEGAMKFFIHAGPQFSYFLNDSRHEEGDWLSSRYHIHQHDQDVEHKFDYGVAGGAGIELRTGIGHFQLEGRYYFGLSDIFGNTKADYFSRSANSVIGIKLTYLYDLMK